jgi:hypothetical protein
MLTYSPPEAIILDQTNSSIMSSPALVRRSSFRKRLKRR